MPSDMYSQNDEERIILQWFLQHGKQTAGRFLDVGAYHATVFSNTRKLFEQGWSGVLVEPGPAQILKLAVAYRGVDRITIVNCALAEALKFQELGICADALSSLDKEHQKTWAAGGTVFDQVQVFTVTVGAFFERFGYNFDFVDIDIEGEANWNLVRTMDFGAIQASLVCVEYGNHREDILRYIMQWNFKLVHDTGENLILGRD